MQPRFPSIPGRVKLQKKPCPEEASQNWTSSENCGGGEAQKTPKKGHLGSRYLISISSEGFFVFLVWGAVATLQSSSPMKWTDSDHFGRICPSLFLTFSDWFSRDKLHPTGINWWTFANSNHLFENTFFSRVVGFYFMSLTAYPPEMNQCPLKGTLHLQPSFSTTTYYF